MLLEFKKRMRKQFKGYKPKDFRRAVVRKWTIRNYRGEEYLCPICDTGLSRFKPIFKSFMRNLAEHGFVHPISSFETLNIQMYLCPSCGASDRERLYALFLREQFDRIDREQKYRFIDFAPSLALSKWIRKHPCIEYVTSDLYRGDVDLNVDIMDMKNFEDNSIDMFLCSHILEHVPDDRKAVRELYRILKPGGFGILMVPIVSSLPTTHEDATKTTPEERTKFFAQGDHLRLYERKDYVKRLEEARFSVNRYNIEFFGGETFHKHGIHENSVLYVVEK